SRHKDQERQIESNEAEQTIEDLIDVGIRNAILHDIAAAIAIGKCDTLDQKRFFPGYPNLVEGFRRRGTPRRWHLRRIKAVVLRCAGNVDDSAIGLGYADKSVVRLGRISFFDFLLQPVGPFRPKSGEQLTSDRVRLLG